MRLQERGGLVEGGRAFGMVFEGGLVQLQRLFDLDLLSIIDFLFGGLLGEFDIIGMPGGSLRLRPVSEGG